MPRKKKKHSILKTTKWDDLLMRPFHTPVEARMQSVDQMTNNSNLFSGIHHQFKDKSDEEESMDLRMLSDGEDLDEPDIDGKDDPKTTETEETILSKCDTLLGTEFINKNDKTKDDDEDDNSKDDPDSNNDEKEQEEEEETTITRSPSPSVSSKSTEDSTMEEIQATKVTEEEELKTNKDTNISVDKELETNVDTNMVDEENELETTEDTNMVEEENELESNGDTNTVEEENEVEGNSETNTVEEENLQELDNDTNAVEEENEQEIDNDTNMVEEDNDLERNSETNTVEEDNEPETNNDIDMAEEENDVEESKDTNIITEKELETNKDINLPVDGKDKIDSEKEKDLTRQMSEESEISRESGKSPTLNSDDLMDVSIIRDANEDAENVYNQEQLDLKERNEDSDDKSSSDKDEEPILNSPKSNSEDKTVCDDGDLGEMSITNAISENQTDNNDEDIEESFSGFNNTLTENNENEDNTNKELDSTLGEKSVCDDVALEKNDEESASNCTIGEQKNAKKRTLSTDSNVSTGSKKSKLDVELQNGEIEKENFIKTEIPRPQIKILKTFSEFMKEKQLKMLTRSTLEEFCLQKICEAMMYKSELGTIHQLLKGQEQMIDTMRKDLQQLTKQARDLEIVNKKLMSDLKQPKELNKSVMPLKITRSVGLQVKMINDSFNVKRRTPNTVNVQRVPPVTNNQINNNLNRNRNIPVNTNNLNKETPPAQKTVPAKSTPILSQALQQTPNRQAVVNDATPNKINSPITATKNQPKPTTETKTSSFIDLTDDDDKKEKNKPVVTVPQRTNAIATKSTTGRNLNNVKTTPVRTVPLKISTSQVKTAISSSSQPLMYVVQSNPTQTTAAQKTVLLNLQPTNGIITSALNNSTVSVVAKPSNTFQLKTVPSIKPVKLPNKHPAPLPLPPLVRLNNDKSYKPVPPKPYLTIRKTDTGIILQWKMPYELDLYEVIASYQLYAYQETSALPSTDMWRKVGDVKALALPMACTLTQFADKNKYYFAVRPVDIHKRIGAFSDPEEISL